MSTPTEPFPVIMGRPIPRDEIIASIREIYQDWCKLESARDGCNSTRLPDFEVMLDYIEKHGLPPRRCRHERVNVGVHPVEGDLVICKDCGKEL